ncbi:MAG: hypothetical protein PHH98_05630 [Candidatus Gracilibacteria bacterium]|nr:hypothetical protein [Candidatus Gracilibacteria bacterium]
MDKLDSNLQSSEEETQQEKSTNIGDETSDSTKGKIRHIIMRDLIKPKSYVSVCSGGVYISSGKYYSDFNILKYKKLKNTSDIYFFVSDEEMDFRELKIPEEIRKKIAEYLRKQDELCIDEKYRLPGGLKSTPMNCTSFAYYIKGRFDNKVGLEYNYLKTDDDIKKVVAGDIIYLIEGDELTGEYWHYMLYLGEGFCLSKNGHAGLIITRHDLKGMYLVKEKLP